MKSNAGEPDNVNKGVGYLSGKLEVCSLSPVALYLTAPPSFNTPTDCISLLPHIKKKN